MLGVGQSFPSFSLKATVSTKVGDEFTTLTEQDHKDSWAVFFFWPMDFTFVCPTEIAEFGSKYDQFLKLGAKLYGASIDSEYVHLAWRNQHPALKNLPCPMLADVKRDLSQELGILDPDAGVSQRATYIVDPKNIIRFASVTDLNVGRNVDEVIRVLEALKNGGLCPCNWQPGDDTLNAA